VAATTRINRYEVSAFYSDHKRDATLDQDTLSDIPEFSAFRETGDHRTLSEISGKNAVREQCWGGNISFRNSFLKIGATGFCTSWNAVLAPQFHPYNRFAFRGDRNLNLGVDVLVHLHRCYLFGEWGESRNGGMAWLAGLQFFPDPRLNIALVCRDYQRNYQDLLGNAMGHNSLNANEQGILFGFNARLGSGLGLSGFVDVYRFPWLKYLTNLVSSGKESILAADYTPDKSVTMYLRFRLRDKQMNAGENPGPVTKWVNMCSESLRYQLEWKVSPSILLKNRIEILWNKAEGEKNRHGYLVYQDLSWKPLKYPVSLSLRYALFDADSYDERIYTYENDVLYGYSVPAFDGNGVRTFLLISWSPFRFLECWIRYGQTWYSDKTSVGTGLELSEGNTRSEVKVQVAVKF
jgi:hypothetical protein